MMAEDYKSSLVTLIVKASNQQYDDQVVECPFTWSVLNLKTHLSETYPSKPSITDQKLIYSGQLLKDNSILRDILRNYDDIEPTNHIFHLVYTPKQRPMTSSSSTSGKSDQTSTSNSSTTGSDGLRQRIIQNRQLNGSNNVTTSGNVNENTTTNTTTPLQSNNCPQIPTFGFPIGASIGVPNYDPNNLLAQQIAYQTWMQQTYAQYMNQYMNQFMNIYGSNPASSSSSATANIPQLPQIPFIPYVTPSIPTIPNNGHSSTGSSGTSSSNILPQTASSQQATNNVGTNQAETATPLAAPNQVNQAPEAPQQAAAPPRFPQIVQEEQENRDWLDTFYSMSRLLLLLVLVYFYSSPLRCLAVLFLGVMIYLYHIGFFRNHLNIGAVEANNNIRNNRNNNQQQAAAAAAEVNAQRNNNNADAAAEINNENNSNNETNETNEPSNSVNGENPNEGTSVIAFLRTFVVSFLTSILPEAPTL